MRKRPQRGMLRLARRIAAVWLGHSPAERVNQVMLHRPHHLALALSLVLFGSCTYLKHAGRQAEYAKMQEADPSQRNLRHMIERQNFTVIGQTLDTHGLYGAGTPGLAIAAFSSRFKENELVQIVHGSAVGSYFGLDLPPGEFEVLALLDLDGNGAYSREEVVGRSLLPLSKENFPAMVVTNHQVELANVSRAAWEMDIDVQAPQDLEHSLVYPVGTIRKLDDPIFSAAVSTLGQYAPASFFEQAPTLFYALEEDLGYKTPVIFVHGIGGRPAEFQPLIDRLDRERYKPWFFYYPSGADLNQLADLFHEIFLSGEVVPRNEICPTIIVAHSMGGLVVRESFNLMESVPESHTPIEFISCATPFGGHPSASFDEDSRLFILPSWRDLDPNGQFIAELYRKPLPSVVNHSLLYAFGDDSMVKFGENSDGVVPLASQLHPAAQQQAALQVGLNETHTGILTEPAGVDAIANRIASVSPIIPEPQMQAFIRGGFEVPIDEEFDLQERFVVRNYGHYLLAMSRGHLTPFNAWEEALVPMLHGEADATHEVARIWLKFVERYPNFEEL